MELYAPDNERTRRLLKRLEEWKRTNPKEQQYAIRKKIYYDEQVNKYLKRVDT